MKKSEDDTLVPLMSLMAVALTGCYEVYVHDSL